MEQIITDLTLLKPAEPLKFTDETGTHKEEGNEIIAKIKEVMEADKDILALAAPQIGINKRIFCVRFSDQIKAFINPILKKKGEAVISFETNVSLPGREIAICRPKEVEAAYYTDEFKYEDNKFLGSAAKIFDQQCQILDGILPGRLIEAVNDGRELEPEDMLALVEAQYSGDGLVVELEPGDHLTTDDLDQAAEILSGYCNQFKAIGDAIRDSEAESMKAVKYVYKNLLMQEQVILGKVQLIADDPMPKMNREQRRAAAKQAQKIKTKKAGKK